MSSRKQAQIEEALKREISKVVLYELADPRIGFVCFTKVKLARDQRSARVSLSVRGDSETVQTTLEALRHARGHIQEKVGKRLPIRFVPVLNFELDQELLKLQRIEKAVHDARESETEDGPIEDMLSDL